MDKYRQSTRVVQLCYKNTKKSIKGCVHSFTNDGVTQERDKQLICELIKTAKYNLIK